MTPATMLLHLGEAMAENERLKSEVADLNQQVANLLTANTKLALPHPARDHVAEAQLILDAKTRRIEALQHQLAQARERLAKIVECEGESAGRFALNPLARLYVTEDGETRMRMSYAGNALVELYEGLK